MRTWWILGTAALLGAGVLATVEADEKMTLPEGPLRERHEVMERNGADAKLIGESLKKGDLATVVAAAERIQKDAAGIPALFPKGSTHPESRAKPEIWESWDRFVQLAKDLEKTAGEVAATAKAGGNAGAATGPMFTTCKTCHDDFRAPEKK